MESPVVIRGTFANQVFIPEGPMPKIEGPAELIVYERPADEHAESRPSIFDCFGKAAHLRSAADIDAQLEEERASWDEA
jgi:hypothetical protein